MHSREDVDMNKSGSMWFIMYLCLTCHAGVASKTLQNHLRSKHRISHQVYGPILRELQAKVQPRTPANFPRPYNANPLSPTWTSKTLLSVACVRVWGRATRPLMVIDVDTGTNVAPSRFRPRFKRARRHGRSTFPLSLGQPSGIIFFTFFLFSLLGSFILSSGSLLVVFFVFSLV